MVNERLYRRIGAVQLSILIEEAKLDRMDKPWKVWNKKRVSSTRDSLIQLRALLRALMKAVEPNPHALDLYFGLGRASWLTLPRSFMNAMPDKWKNDMANLLNEYEKSFDWDAVPSYDTHVTLKRNGKFVKVPEFINYRTSKTPKEIYKDGSP